MPTLPEQVTYEELPPDGWTLNEFQLIPPVIGQGELVGDWFKRDGTHGVVFQGGKAAQVPHERRVRVAAGVGPDNKTIFTTDPSEGFDPSEFPHMSIRYARIDPDGKPVYDAADDGPPSLETVRSHGASTAGFTSRPGSHDFS